MKKVIFLPLLFFSFQVLAQCYTMVSAGTDHSLAIKIDGTLWSWGNNASGQLGLGDNSLRRTPSQVGSENDWLLVVAGGARSYAIKADGTLWAWGNNIYGVLGDSTRVDRNTPIQIGKDRDWQTISAGTDHTLAIKKDGSLWAWGQNVREADNYPGQATSGQLGIDDSITRFVYAPVRVGEASDWKAVSGGLNHSVGLKTDGTLWVWGANSSGQLGDGTYLNRYKPKQLGTDNNWKTISAGYNFSLATKENNTLWGCGANFWGQVGTQDASWTQNLIIRVGTDTNWTDARAGDKHACGLKTNGTIWIWGDKDDGMSNSHAVSYTPVQVGTDSTWKSISLTWSHNIALKTDASLWAWGYAGAAALGTGAFGNSVTYDPVKIPCHTSLPVPRIFSFINLSGCGTGSTLKIKGQNFTGTTSVTIGGGVVASFTVNADTLITAITGPSITGKINVVNASGTAVSVDSLMTNCCFWTGAQDTSWENKANWSCGFVPDASTNVYVNSGEVVVSSNAVVNSLHLSNQANLKISTGYNLKVLN